MSTAAMRRASATIGPGVVETGPRSALIMTSGQTASAHTTGRCVSQMVRAENTYKMEPDKCFPFEKVRDIIKKTMEEMLDGRQYDAASCTVISGKIADVIKQRVKELGNPRFKIVSIVAIGHTQDTTISFSSRCVWNEKYDTFAEHAYKNKDLYALGLVYAMYCE